MTIKELAEKNNCTEEVIYLIFKFGRFIPDRPHRFDEVLGVELASDNQFAVNLMEINVRYARDMWKKLVEIENLRIVPKGGSNGGESVVPVINEGFHSFTTRHLEKLIGKGNRQKKIAIIPKGAQYAKGTDNDIVSNRIIVFSSYWKFIKYLICTQKKN
jgi:hypothetical protein